MANKAVTWAVGNLKTIARTQAARIKPYQQGPAIPPEEQLRRYQAGEERWRLEAGLVSRQDWDRYEQAMQRLMQQGG